MGNGVRHRDNILNGRLRQNRLLARILLSYQNDLWKILEEIMYTKRCDKLLLRINLFCHIYSLWRIVTKRANGGRV